MLMFVNGFCQFGWIAPVCKGQQRKWSTRRDRRHAFDFPYPRDGWRRRHTLQWPIAKSEIKAPMRTLYDKLGVPRHASASDIDQSYRHSLSEHIAGNRNRPLRRKDQLRLQQMRQAYLVLSSPSSRLDYDLKLDQLEHARLRRIERIGTAFGLLLLLAGLALIARGYYGQVYDGQPIARAAATSQSAASTPRDNTVLVAGDRTAQPALNPRTD
jgi:hypothetical protein